MGMIMVVAMVFMLMGALARFMFMVMISVHKLTPLA
jgi:hypothetical protein